MSPEEAMDRINLILAHAWMVRNFLKHADEVQEDAEMLDVHRMIYDYTRAVEPSLQRRDAAEYVRRAKGKLSKLKKSAAFFQANYERVSSHTNFQMAAISLTFVVQQIEEVLAMVDQPPPQPLSPGGARGDCADSHSAEEPGAGV